MKLVLQVVVVLVLLGVSVLWWGPEERSEPVEPPLLSAAPASDPASASAPREEREGLASPAEREPIALPAAKGREPEVAVRSTGIDGRCVDRDRVPVHGARVAERGEIGEGALTGADGMFSLEIQGEGARWVRLEASGFGTRILEAVVQRSETTHLGDVVLLAGGVVRGHVQSSSGGPVAGATVTITGKELGDDYGARGGTVRPDLEGLRRAGLAHHLLQQGAHPVEVGHVVDEPDFEECLLATGATPRAKESPLTSTPEGRAPSCSTPLLHKSLVLNIKGAATDCATSSTPPSAAPERAPSARPRGSEHRTRPREGSGRDPTRPAQGRALFGALTDAPLRGACRRSTARALGRGQRGRWPTRVRGGPTLGTIG